MNSLRFLPMLMVGLAVVVALTPAALEAQDAEERIENALARALDAGIPTELLESKVAEGRAKGVPADRIAAAVQRRVEGLERAQEALASAGDVDAGDLTVAADALESGVSAEVLGAVAEMAPDERRAVAIAALSHLVDQGVAAPEALAAVEDALARGPAALANLPAKAGGPPVDLPAGGAGPPAGVPAPGDLPGVGPPDGAGPPDGVPGGGPPGGSGGS